MKNWEKYEKEIRLSGVDDLALLEDGTLSDCYVVDYCEGCVFVRGQEICSCSKRKTDWLYQEYEEKLTLTEAEAEFLKLITNGYIARDKDNTLWLFNSNPNKDESVWFDECHIQINGNIFKFITWKSGKAWSLDELRELEVAE